MSQINRTDRGCRHLLLSNVNVLLLFFTCGSLVHIACALTENHNNNNSRFVYNKSKADIHAEHIEDTNLKLLEENKADPVPMDFYRQLNNITDISEFIDKFIDPESLDPKWGIHENLKRPVERAAVVRAKAANCIPENSVVDLTPLNPKNNYFPRCTRVKRCGGCCSTQWMSCQPTKIEVINFQVYRYCYDEGAKFCGLDVIPVEQHLECKCDCRIKPEDCNAFQRYQDCRCHCTNDEARSKCLQLDHKTWDDVNCRCVCKQNENCTTGSYYDENQCKCVLPPRTGSEAEGSPMVTVPLRPFDRRRFIVKPVAVDTDNSTIYDL
ncbi:uncharacterized protein LOC119639092 isoform X1 [Glossina fuscipes]|uniref:Uncharacterized protein LOC119639092 isoform X1 n=1 Tax=Glossina fuscipes TaxID=7396 RepID=A0A9C6DU64_9MUSC|nr:uncharacterized protein LOC119639092 isoform X1 [Glossina fuscipes]